MTYKPLSFIIIKDINIIFIVLKIFYYNKNNIFYYNKNEFDYTKIC